jgi:hypothetical protein
MCHLIKSQCVCHVMGGYKKGKIERYIPFVSIYDYDTIYHIMFYIIVIIINNSLKCVITEV